MDAFVIVLTAAATLDLLVAVLFAIGFLRRPADREQGIAALLCAAAAAHASGSLFAAGARNAGAALVANQVAVVGLVAVLPTAVHFATAYRGSVHSWRTVAVLYAAAGGLGVLDLNRGLIAPVTLMAHAPRSAVHALDIAHRGAPLAAEGVWTYVAALVAAGSVLVTAARAYLAGRSGALAVAAGAAVLLAAVLNDLGVASGAFTTIYVTDVGLAVFVAGIATTSSARYAAVAQDLESRTKELRTRTRELRRSYEDLRATQEELIKKEQLAVVGELAAVIAHEVRNPLAIIANAVAGLRKQAISREDHDTLLAIMDEETSRLNRLVSDLLRYARPVNVQRSHILLADLLERALSLATANAKTVRVDLRAEAHEGRVWGDSNLLRQVFDNLIDNAVQAMGGGGALTVRVRAKSEEGVEGLAVDITDTGEGMDTQVRSRALDPFFTTRPSGTGLGLAIVDRIVDAHGGRLAIESRAGEGTTVTVFLPHGSASEPPAARPRSSKPSFDPPRSERAAR